MCPICCLLALSALLTPFPGKASSMSPTHLYIFLFSCRWFGCIMLRVMGLICKVIAQHNAKEPWTPSTLSRVTSTPSSSPHPLLLVFIFVFSQINTVLPHVLFLYTKKSDLILLVFQPSTNLVRHLSLPLCPYHNQLHDLILLHSCVLFHRSPLCGIPLCV